jgi:tRNA threonylcarbamoyladenosine biosynthesis protein TsaB
MMILSIDSAGRGCGICVFDDGRVLSLREETMERGQDARLIPMVQEALGEAKLDFAALDRIVAVRGPGSFTGLRIGLAAARGFALAASKPVFGIDRFSIYYEQLKGKEKDMLVALDSRRHELFTCFYEASGKAGEPVLMTPEDITAWHKKHASAMITGDAPELLKDVAAVVPLSFPEVQTAAEIAAKLSLGDPDYLARPLYLRAPDVTFPCAGRAS